MAFQWPIDKLTLINSALALSGDNLVNSADDGSDEWTVASPAYERGLAYAMESHNWGFAASVVTLQPSPTAPTDTAWDTAYPIPADCVHIVWLKINQDATDPVSNVLSSMTLYDIMVVNGQAMIVVNAQGGPPPPATPQQPAQITLKYLSNAGALCDPTSGTPTLILALQIFVQSGIFAGLHEDMDRAERMWTQGERMLQMARSRYDMQKPKRNMWNSRLFASRRVRRPWPPQGNDNWGGSGIPG